MIGDVILTGDKPAQNPVVQLQHLYYARQIKLDIKLCEHTEKSNIMNMSM